MTPRAQRTAPPDGAEEGGLMLMKQARDMLENQLIPFWAALRDDEYGGFYGQMG